MNVLCVIGTRPEAIKMAPVVRALQAEPDAFRVRLCLTAQHRDLVAPVLAHFGLDADYDLNVMRPDQSLAELTSALFAALPSVVNQDAPDVVLVQGDTTSAMVTAMTAFHAGVPVGHVEAGLRTGRFDQPFPEEMNRVLIDRLAHAHFAPTEAARENLLREHTEASRISVTGNTVIDALRWTLAQAPALPALMADTDTRRIVFVTVHRRESFGAPLETICDALVTLSNRVAADVLFVVAVHPNPNVIGPVRQRLARLANILLLDPLDYPQTAALLSRCYLVLTDSGGLQEEAPSLGKPVLVMRDVTERPEGIAAGVSRLVGRESQPIVDAVQTLLEDKAAYEEMARPSHVFGDGHAAGRIVQALRKTMWNGVA